MQYEIIGGNLPAVLCRLTRGEKIICEGGGMSWMDDAFTMETSGGGLKKMFSRAFTGESMFINTYTAQRDGEIAFASSFPGEILAVDLRGGKSIIAQKKAFLAMEAGVNMNVFFQKRMSGGFFGGEGFILQQFSGNGVVFLEVDGSIREYMLAPARGLLLLYSRSIRNISSYFNSQFNEILFGHFVREFCHRTVTRHQFRLVEILLQP